MTKERFDELIELSGGKTQRPVKSIFRNEAGNIYLDESTSDQELSILFDYAVAQGLEVFSAKTRTWESFYWNADEKKLGGCLKVMAHLPDRKTVSFDEFFNEARKPAKRIKNNENKEDSQSPNAS